MTNAHLQRRVTDALTAAERWLWSMQVPGRPAGTLRISDHHDPQVWPGMLLPGTYNGLMALALIRALDGRIDADAVAAQVLESRLSDGRFRIAGMADDAVFKKPDREETWRYVDFHVTNYSLGVLEVLGRLDPPVLDFVRPFLDPQTLLAWLALRDLRDPWQEGNNVVNLGSFLLLLDDDRARGAVDILMEWHDRNQEPATGFWGVGQTSDLGALHAMAGATHNYHLYYALDRPIPYLDAAVDYCLTQPTAVSSACIDVDLVDILSHARGRVAHREADVDAWLRTKLAAILDFQSSDGGFADETAGTRRQDGWVGGYAEPQGISNTFATWFRLIAVAMVCRTLWPAWRDWRFRRMIGIGYFRPAA